MEDSAIFSFLKTSPLDEARPANVRTAVDFPAPDIPVMAMRSPGHKSNDSCSTTGRLRLGACAQFVT